MAKCQRWFLILKNSCLTDICPVLYFDLREMHKVLAVSLPNSSFEFELIHFLLCSAIFTCSTSISIIHPSFLHENVQIVRQQCSLYTFKAHHNFLYTFLLYLPCIQKIFHFVETIYMLDFSPPKQWMWKTCSISSDDDRNGRKRNHSV